MIGMAGASRMSSVFGLNARPQTAMVLPFSDAEVRLHLLHEHRFCNSLTDSTALRILKSYFLSAENRISALTSFGKQLPP